jgi:hypothetical protein
MAIFGQLLFKMDFNGIRNVASAARYYPKIRNFAPINIPL